MNTLERRALYNLLRMNWLNEQTLSVESWQVEDYRSLPLIDLFDRLKQFDIQLNRASFIAYADESDSPEELTEHLVGDRELPTTQEDQIYLIVFELWRRFLSEKPSLSILCNELDHQIFLYDQQKLENPLALQDALTHFAQILDENVDEGIEPEQALKLISIYCANDIETFLYDFIAEQIDEGNESYAHELLTDFDAYIFKNKWFKLLQLRLCEPNHSKTAQKLAHAIIEEHLHDQDPEYHLELLSVLAEMGDPSIFRLIVKNTIPLIKVEEEFQDLLVIAIDYFHRLGHEQEEMALKNLFEKRAQLPLDQPFSSNNQDLTTLTTLFSLDLSRNS